VKRFVKLCTSATTTFYDVVTDHIGAELEESLGAIEEVTGYLKIVRSYALLSLRFLKSLSVIGGERLYDNR